MSHDLTVSGQDSALVQAGAVPLDQNPAAVYLAGLGSRRVMRQALDAIARLLDPGADAPPCPSTTVALSGIE